MKLLVIGGAGYVGSHFVNRAQKKDHEITVIDDFSTGNKWAIKGCEIIDLNILNKPLFSRAIKGKDYDAVVHFAAKSIVSESVKEPDLYYKNNFVGTMNICDVLIENNIKHLIFSSTAAVYGNPKSKKITETHQKVPINPYGKSKLMVENLFYDLSISNNLNSVSLRYFNAAGADENGKIGEAHKPETHLIPNILNAIKNDTEFYLFGDDYNTYDGTCIRDYIHVNDLANAHLKAIDFLSSNRGCYAFNLGIGNGFSVKEVINSCERITGSKLKFKVKPRRQGDPDILVANSDSAKKHLRWKPKYNTLDYIIETAWNWHRKYE